MIPVTVVGTSSQPRLDVAAPAHGAVPFLRAVSHLSHPVEPRRVTRVIGAGRSAGAVIWGGA